MKHNRIFELDAIKAIAIIMVVVGHTNCPTIIHSMFYYIHVPLFFIASGYVSKPLSFYYTFDNVKKLIVKRILSLYIPFVLFSLIIVCLHNSFVDIGLLTDKYTIESFLNQVVRTLLFSNGIKEPFLTPLWFMKTLFLCEVFHSLLVYILHNFKLPLLIYPLFSMMALWLDGELVPDIVRTSVIWPLSACVYYMAGISIKCLRMYRQEVSVTKFVSGGAKICSLIIFSCLWLGLSETHPVAFQKASSYEAFIQLVLTIWAFYVFWQVSHYINMERLIFIRNIVIYIGQHTLPIYFYHKMLFFFISFSYSSIVQYSSINRNGITINVEWYYYVLSSIIAALIIDKIVKLIKILIIKKV